jgi:hypothetical protein
VGPPSSFCPAQRAQGLGRVGDAGSERRVVVGRDPAREGDVEDRHGTVGGQGRGGLGDSALVQRRGGRLGERGELEQLALLQARVGGDDLRTAYGVLAPVLEQASGCDRAGQGRVER